MLPTPLASVSSEIRSVFPFVEGKGIRRCEEDRPVSPFTGTKKPEREVHASRQLHGKYMSMIRQIPKRARDKLKRTAKEKSREAAIEAMRNEYLIG